MNRLKETPNPMPNPMPNPTPNPTVVTARPVPMALAPPVAGKHRVGRRCLLQTELTHANAS